MLIQKLLMKVIILYLKKLVLRMLNEDKNLRPNGKEALDELEIIEFSINNPKNQMIKNFLEEDKSKLKKNNESQNNNVNNQNNYFNQPLNNNLNNNFNYQNLDYFNNFQNINYGYYQYGQQNIFPVQQMNNYQMNMYYPNNQFMNNVQ